MLHLGSPNTRWTNEHQLVDFSQYPVNFSNSYAFLLSVKSYNPDWSDHPFFSLNGILSMQITQGIILATFDHPFNEVLTLHTRNGYWIVGISVLEEDGQSLLSLCVKTWD